MSTRGPCLSSLPSPSETLPGNVISTSMMFGFRTAIFASARDFLDSPQFPNVSCAILDVSMPGMDGLELQRHLVATHPIPIIFITDLRDAKTREQAVRAGVISFLNKPVSEETLIDALNSALRA